MAGGAEDMDQGYGGWCGRLRGGAGRWCRGTVRTPCRGPWAGDYTRARLPQFGLAERRPGRARAAHWTLALSFPGRCVRIGRRGLRTLAGFGGPTMGRTSGGASGSRGRSSFSAPAGSAGPCRTPPLCRPGVPFGRRHKMAAPGWGRSYGGSSWGAGSAAWDRDGTAASSRAVVPVWEPAGLAGASVRHRRPGALVPKAVWAALGRTPCRQPGGAEQRGLVQPLQWSTSLGACRGPGSCRSGTRH